MNALFYCFCFIFLLLYIKSALTFLYMISMPLHRIALRPLQTCTIRFALYMTIPFLFLFIVKHTISSPHTYLLLYDIFGILTGVIILYSTIVINFRAFHYLTHS